MENKMIAHLGLPDIKEGNEMYQTAGSFFQPSLKRLLPKAIKSGGQKGIHNESFAAARGENNITKVFPVSGCTKVPTHSTYIQYGYKGDHVVIVEALNSDGNKRGNELTGKHYSITDIWKHAKDKINGYAVCILIFVKAGVSGYLS
ncbi:uncharacterized protein H6S33_012048 [Morchella sextelata]|uniref:uncharacterized protein n=1 Tax=Morchella sextelata TaxID=1174677 RepID=UPI001D03CF32|nr:uncharacterized protein H6S33_012048 [Morchella sextelata]KAH0610521.1 hypothetical protein H6S33_012048 [Morchella sextelata]